MNALLAGAPTRDGYARDLLGDPGRHEAARADDRRRRRDRRPVGRVRVGRGQRVRRSSAGPGGLHADPVPDGVVRPVQVDGEVVTVFGSEGIVLDGPVGRDDFEDQLPAIFVDRPASGAAIGNPARVAGNANVFEATFRVALLDGEGRVLADEMAMATCGTGCRGTFDDQVGYDVSEAQWGTLRSVGRVGRRRQSGERPRVPGLADAGRLTGPGRVARSAAGGPGLVGEDVGGLERVAARPEGGGGGLGFGLGRRGRRLGQRQEVRRGGREVVDAAGVGLPGVLVAGVRRVLLEPVPPRRWSSRRAVARPGRAAPASRPRQPRGLGPARRGPAPPPCA